MCKSAMAVLTSFFTTEWKRRSLTFLQTRQKPHIYGKILPSKSQLQFGTLLWARRNWGNIGEMLGNISMWSVAAFAGSHSLDGRKAKSRTVLLTDVLNYRNKKQNNFQKATN